MEEPGRAARGDLFERAFDSRDDRPRSFRGAIEGAECR
jgi:hypothetical protein